MIRLKPQDFDMQELIMRIEELISKISSVFVDEMNLTNLESYCNRMHNGFLPEHFVITKADCALELGSPRRLSLNAVFWTKNDSIIKGGRIRRVGLSLQDAVNMELDYAQLIFLSVKEGFEINPFKLESVQFLSDRLPGVMARIVPGRLWLRVSKRAISEGLNFNIFGSALISAYLDEVEGVSKAECLFINSDRGLIERFFAFASEAKIITGRHKRIVLASDGDYECKELNCDACEDKPVCDIIREVKSIRKRKQTRN